MTGRLGGDGSKDLKTVKAERLEKERQFKAVALWVSVALFVAVTISFFLIPWNGKYTAFQMMRGAGGNDPAVSPTPGGNAGGRPTNGQPAPPRPIGPPPQTVLDFQSNYQSYLAVQSETENFVHETEGLPLAQQIERLPRIDQYLEQVGGMHERALELLPQIPDQALNDFNLTHQADRQIQRMSQTVGALRRLKTDIEYSRDHPDQPPPGTPPPPEDPRQDP